MLKPRKWPFGADTPTDRARTIARSCYTALRGANPGIADQILELARDYGEDAWLAPSHAAPPDGRWLSRDDVARLAGVRPVVVSNWGSRGLTRRGETRRLTKHPEGWHPDEVHDFLAWRDQPPPPPRDRSTARA